MNILTEHFLSVKEERRNRGHGHITKKHRLDIRTFSQTQNSNNGTDYGTHSVNMFNTTNDMYLHTQIDRLDSHKQQGFLVTPQVAQHLVIYHITLTPHDCPQAIVYIDIRLQTKMHASIHTTPTKEHALHAPLPVHMQGTSQARLPMYVPDYIYIYRHICIDIYNSIIVYILYIS